MSDTTIDSSSIFDPTAEINADAETGEFPIIDTEFMDDTVSQEGRPGLGATDPEPDTFIQPSAKFSLEHLQSEVDRLRLSWTRIAEQLADRDERIRRLQEQISDQDAHIGRLKDRLEAQDEEKSSLEGELSAAEARLNGMASMDTERAGAIAELEAALAIARTKCEELEAAVAKQESEREALQQEVREAAANAESVEARTSSLRDEKKALEIKIQDLEHYLDGRQKGWDELNNQVAAQAQSLKELEGVIKEKDADLGRVMRDKDTAEAQIRTLEQQAAEHAGRRDERERAFESLQAKMDQERRDAEATRQELKAREKEADSVLDQAASQEKERASLERGVERRDERIGELESALAEQEQLLADEQAEKFQLNTKVAELELLLSERADSGEALRSELDRARQEVDRLRIDLTDRSGRLDQLEAGSHEQREDAKALQAELVSLREERAELRVSLENATARLSELETRREDLETENRDLQAEIGEQMDRVLGLENELEDSRRTADMLDRNVRQINDLGASLEALDRQLATSSSDLLTPEELLGETQILPASEGAIRKLLVTMGGKDAIKYPLFKDDILIGRSGGSDIQIQSRYVSRTHARVVMNGDLATIEDAGSKNGIKVNERLVRDPVTLKDGDVVSLGKLQLRYVDLNEANASGVLN